MIELILARQAVRESARARWFLLIPAAFAALVPLAWGARHMAIGSAAKAANDLGLLAVWLVASACAIGLGVTAARLDGEAVWALVRPVTRGQVVRGRFLGVVATLGLLVGGLVLAWVAAASLNGIAPGWGLFAFAAMLALEAALVAACGTLFSNLTTPGVAAFATTALWIVGHLSAEYRAVDDLPPLTVLWWFVPDLDVFDVQALVVHNVPVDGSSVGLAVVYATAWMVALITVTTIAVSRRDVA